MQLVSRFRNTSGIRAGMPLSDDQIRAVTPSIFAEAAHESRSARYTYIPTIDVLDGLRKGGFQPFMVCQTRVRNEEKREHAKHMIRLRHADQIAGREANEIILLSSHNGTSSYQMLAGMFRFVCSNDMVCGETTSDIRARHNGDVMGDVIESAFKMLGSFEEATTQCEAMQVSTPNQGEQVAFARAALTLKCDDQDSGAAPVTKSQILAPRRFEDRRDDMWTTFNRVRGDMMKDGLRGRDRNGCTTTTCPVNGIDQSVKLNRALWVLVEEMRRLKG